MYFSKKNERKLDNNMKYKYNEILKNIIKDVTVSPTKGKCFYYDSKSEVIFEEDFITKLWEFSHDSNKSVPPVRIF